VRWEAQANRSRTGTRSRTCRRTGIAFSSGPSRWGSGIHARNDRAVVSCRRGRFARLGAVGEEDGDPALTRQPRRRRRVRLWGKDAPVVGGRIAHVELQEICEMRASTVFRGRKSCRRRTTRALAASASTSRSRPVQDVELSRARLRATRRDSIVGLDHALGLGDAPGARR